jgi:malonyl CoA-acyl carrier protein transacylase
MLADLFVAFPRLRRLLRSGEKWAGTLFPPAAFTKDEKAAQQAAITDTRVAQPTLGIAGMAMFDVLRSVGVQPDLLAGHSYGELVALAAAAALDEDDLLQLSEARADAILEAAGDDPGAMAAVSGSGDDVRQALGDDSGVVVANDNSPSQAVISGPTASVEAAVERLGDAGLRAKRLPVACAFHSPVVAAAAETFAARLDSSGLGVPQVPVWSNTTVAPYPDDVAGVRATLAGQVAQSVRFREQIEAMHDAGARVFVEVGPGRVLTQLVGKILGDRPHVAVATDASGEPGIPRLLTALAALAVQGVALDPAPLFAGREAKVLRADQLEARPRWTIDGHLVRTADGQVVPGSLQPADQVPTVIVGGPMGAGAGGVRDAAVVEYLRGTRELIAAQRDVLLSYLGGPVGEPTQIAAVEAMVTAASPAPLAAADAGLAASVGPGPGPAGGDASSLTPEQLLAAVLRIVSDRTGYPLEMLDPDLDLEADLSIDSIKRIEIVGELADQVGLPGADGGGAIDESVVEELAQLKTLRGIVDWIVALGDGAGGSVDASGAGTPEDAPLAETGIPVPDGLLRFVPELVELDPPVLEPAGLSGRSAAVVDDGRGVALELTDRLEAAGVAVQLLRNGDQPGPVDIYIDLALLAPGEPAPLVTRFTRLRDVVLAGATSVLIATPLGGAFGLAGADHDGDLLDRAGLRGLAKSVAREVPEVRVRVVDLAPKDEAGVLAGYLFDELVATDEHVEVGRLGAARRTVELVEVPLDGAGVPPLEAGSVVLLTGGARGITARVAVGLAAATGCAVELVGRSPAPAGAEADDLAGAADAPALRKALIARGLSDPATIEAEVAVVTASREIAGTLAVLGDLGVAATYHQADVRDAEALAAVVADVRARHGRLDGIVHGAGVLEDRFLRDKTPESFDRVVGTKLDGARALVAALGPDTRFLVLFGSIAGVFGNRGQVDYATANDALDTLAHRLDATSPTRVVALDWGPWAGGGMVSPELEREYTRRGVGLVDPEQGVTALLRELASPAGPAQVVLMRALPDALR